jgi:methionyl aminopeptidase
MIVLKGPEEIEIMRAANVIVAEVLAELRAAVRPGVTTGDLDRIAEELTRKKGAIPAFKGYSVAGRVYPASLCASINEEVVHGIPSASRTLREGDIIGLDYGVLYRGYYGDSAVTVPVGTVTPEAEALMRATREALEAGIEAARPGRRLGDVSSAIQTHAESRSFSVVRDFVGHGIGKRLHEDPQVPNFGQADRGIRLREGMVLAIEPMLNVGGPEVELKEDGWTAITSDGSLSAHFEHSIAIVEGGPYVLSSL